MSKDYTDTLGRVGPGSANPEIAVNDALAKTELALNDVSAGALPEPTTVGQVLTLIAGPTGGTGPAILPAWGDAPESLPPGGTEGQVLARTADGYAWIDPPEGGGSVPGPTGPTGASGGGSTGSGGSYSDRFSPPLAAQFPDTTTVNVAGTVTMVDDPDVGLTLTLPSIAGDKPSAALMNVPTSGDWEVICKMVPNEVGANYHSLGFILWAPTDNSVNVFGFDLGQSGLSINVNRYRKVGGFDGVKTAYAGYTMPEWFRVKYDSVALVYNLYFSKDGKNWSFYGAYNYALTGGGPVTKIGFGFGCNHQRNGLSFCMSVPYFWKSWN